MKTNFTKATSDFGCYGPKKASSYLPNENFTIADVLNANVRLRDKAWFIRNNCQFTDDEYRQYAIGCALCVLPIYEKRYPGNNAPREAIEAGKAYLAGTINIDVLREKRDAAAYAADASADAAYAASAYADAAYAADASSAAAYAADASADAAYASAYADAAYASAYAAYASSATDASSAAAYAADDADDAAYAYASAYAAYASSATDASASAYASAAADDADDAADGKTDYRSLLLEFFKEFTAVKETV
jgi:hypothetical protein